MRGEYAAEPGAVVSGRTITLGIYAGLIAGAVFAVAEMVVALLMGGTWDAPWRAFASIVGGQEALMVWNPGTALGVGLLVHAVLSAIYGVIYNVGAGSRLATEVNWQSITGGSFGLLVWIVNFLLLAPAFWPWFREANQLVQAVLHVFFYGLPLGLALAALWTRAPVRRPRAA